MIIIIIRTFNTVFCKLTGTNKFQRQTVCCQEQEIVCCQEQEIQHWPLQHVCFTTCLYELECSQIANFMAENANINSLAEKRILNSRECMMIRIRSNSISTETNQMCAHF